MLDYLQPVVQVVVGFVQSFSKIWYGKCPSRNISQRSYKENTIPILSRFKIKFIPLHECFGVFYHFKVCYHFKRSSLILESIIILKVSYYFSAPSICRKTLTFGDCNIFEFGLEFTVYADTLLNSVSSEYGLVTGLGETDLGANPNNL